MSRVDQAGLVSFLRKTKKTLDFPVCCRLLKCPTPLHFLPSLVPVSDLLAALYNLCFVGVRCGSALDSPNLSRVLPTSFGDLGPSKWEFWRCE